MKWSSVHQRALTAPKLVKPLQRQSCPSLTVQEIFSGRMLLTLTCPGAKWVLKSRQAADCKDWKPAAIMNYECKPAGQWSALSTKMRDSFQMKAISNRKFNTTLKCETRSTVAALVSGSRSTPLTLTVGWTGSSEESPSRGRPRSWRSEQLRWGAQGDNWMWRWDGNHHSAKGGSTDHERPSKMEAS